MAARNISEMLNDKAELDKIGVRNKLISRTISDKLNCERSSTFVFFFLSPIISQLCDKYMIYRRGANEHCGRSFFFFTLFLRLLFWLDLRTEQNQNTNARCLQCIAVHSILAVSIHIHVFFFFYDCCRCWWLE